MKIAVIQIDYQNKIFHPLKTTLFVSFYRLLHERMITVLTISHCGIIIINHDFLNMNGYRQMTSVTANLSSMYNRVAEI